MLAQKIKKRHRNTHKERHTHTRTHTFTESLRSNCHQVHVIREEPLISRNSEEYKKNVKQVNVKMLFSALAPCVLLFFLFLIQRRKKKSGMCFFNKQVEPHMTCPMISTFLSFFSSSSFKCHSLKAQI